MNKQLSHFYWMQLFFRYIEKCRKKEKFSHSWTEVYSKKTTVKKKPKFPRKTGRRKFLYLESENVIGNQDDSEQARPQRDTNVKDTNVCGDMLHKVLDYVQIQTRLHMPYIGRGVLPCDCAYAAHHQRVKRISLVTYIAYILCCFRQRHSL